MSTDLHTLTKSELIERLATEQKTAQSHLEQLADLRKKLASKEQTERWLNQKIAQLQRMIFGQKRERFAGDPDQGLLPFEASDEEHSQQETRHEEEITYVRCKPSKSNHKGRLTLPDHLPVEEIEIYPDGDLEGMVCIGKEVTEELELEPARFYIKRYIHYKYAPADPRRVGLSGDGPAGDSIQPAGRRDQSPWVSVGRRITDQGAGIPKKGILPSGLVLGLPQPDRKNGAV